MPRSVVAAQQQIKFYSQPAETAASSPENNENGRELTNDTAEVEKLYSSLEVELRGSDPAVMRSFQRFAVSSANHLGIEVGRVYVFSLCLLNKGEARRQ